MKDKQYVTTVCNSRGFSLHAPTKKSPEVLAIDYKKTPASIVIDAKNWEEARAQINRLFL